MPAHKQQKRTIAPKHAAVLVNCAGTKGLSIVVAAGPYSSKDDATYEPLQALLGHCKEQGPPDVLVLLGPFVDAEHPLVQAGSLEESFGDAFAAQVLLYSVTSYAAATSLFLSRKPLPTFCFDQALHAPCQQEKVQRPHCHAVTTWLTGL